MLMDEGQDASYDSWNNIQNHHIKSSLIIGKYLPKRTVYRFLVETFESRAISGQNLEKMGQNREKNFSGSFFKSFSF